MASLLAVDDYVGISFFVTSMALLATTIFFYQERELVNKKWQTSMTVMTIVTFIAFVHYMYMRELWVVQQASPLTYRYIDWFITVPLVAGYIGEAGFGSAMIYFGIGMLAWFAILYEVFFGVAGYIYSKVSHVPTKIAFNGLRFIVTVGWAIYPIGYVYGYLMPNPDIDKLNIIYNLADFINKIAFGMMIWYAARCDADKITKSEWS